MNERKTNLTYQMLADLRASATIKSEAEAAHKAARAAVEAALIADGLLDAETKKPIGGENFTVTRKHSGFKLALLVKSIFQSEKHIKAYTYNTFTVGQAD